MANVLLGLVYAVNFMSYIFPLLFFKRLADVFAVEMTEVMAVSAGDTTRQFFVGSPKTYGKLLQTLSSEMLKEVGW